MPENTPPAAMLQHLAPGWSPFATTRARAIELVSWPSETGSPDEVAFAPRLRDMLLRIPYFRNNPGDVVLLPSHGNPVRHNLVAIVRGAGAQAVALAGHYDTVATDNYLQEQPLACQPEPLRAALIAALEAAGGDPLALADLRSGAFLPGRGMLDMKSGLAAAVAVLERHAARADRRGTLVLLASPDEERESRGIRALRADLPGLLAERGLEICAAVNLDSTSDQGDGSAGRTVYEGSIGKLAPCALVLGRPAHAAYPFEGISAARLGAEVVCAIEAAPAFADAGGGDLAPPPVALEACALRNGYEVTTPARMWLAFNWLYHSGSAADRLAAFESHVADALQRACAAHAGAAQGYAALGGAGAGASPPPRVIRAEALLERLRADPVQAQGFEDLQAALAGDDNPLAVSCQLMQALADTVGVEGPAAVVGLASLHYPPVRLDPTDPTDAQAARMERALDRLQAECAEDPQARFRRRPHFQGISDMSFMGQRARPGAGVIAANTPAARMIDRPGADAPVFPVVNIGPWGRDFHQRLERVHAVHAFDRLPRVVARLADLLLADAAPGA